MADYKKLIPHILKWEGGWANDPDDKGGPTMKGITLNTYKVYCRQKGKPIPTQATLKKISQEEWEDVFKTLFWDKWKADQIKSQSIANLVVDWMWGSGQWGIKYPQSVLEVAVDGIVGLKTLSTINNYPDQRALFDKLWARRKAHFEGIAKANVSQKKFLKGWLNRLNDLKFID